MPPAGIILEGGADERRLRFGSASPGGEAAQGGAAWRPVGAPGRPRGAREEPGGDPQHARKDTDECCGTRVAVVDQPDVGRRVSLTPRTPAGAIRSEHVGREVDVYGWVHRRREPR